jgi:hypothetical protein
MPRLDAGQSKLSHSLKSLLEKWDIAQEHWKDRVRQEFEERYLEELQERVRATTGAMERLSEMLSRAEKECR